MKTVVADLSEEVKENILSLTDCVLCGADLVDSYDEFVASKFIECCHSVCRDCLSKWDSAEKRYCPSCFLDVEKKLLDNIILQEIIDGTTMKKKATFCGVHTANPTTHWCYGCGDSICEECIKYHSDLKETQSHVIKTKEEHWDDPSARYMCRSHPKEHLKLFCLTCNEITCRDCQLYNHRDHIYDFVSEIVDNAKMTLHKENVFLRYQLNILQKALPMIQGRKKKIEDDSERIAKEINDTAASLIVKITKKKHSLLSRLRFMSKSQTEAFEKNEKEIKEKVNTIKHCTTFTLNVLKNNSDFSIIHSKAHILRHMERIKSYNFEIPNPSCSKIITFKDNTIDIVPGPRRQPGPVQGTVGTVSLKDEILVDLATFADEIEQNLKLEIPEEIKQEIEKIDSSKEVESSILQSLIQNDQSVESTPREFFPNRRDQIGITLEENNAAGFTANATAGAKVAGPSESRIKLEPASADYQSDKIDQMPLLNDLLQNSGGKDFPISRSVEDLFNKNTQKAKEPAKTSIDDEIFKLLQGDETPLDFGGINTNQGPNEAVPSAPTDPVATQSTSVAPTPQNTTVGQIRPIQTSMLIKTEDPPQQNEDYLLNNIMSGNQDYRYLNENQLRVLKPPPPYTMTVAQPSMTWYRHPVQTPQPQFLPQYTNMSMVTNRSVVPNQSMVPRTVVPNQSMVPRTAVPNQSMVPRTAVPNQSMVPNRTVVPNQFVPIRPLLTNQSMVPSRTVAPNRPASRPAPPILCTVCQKPRSNVLCQTCKRSFHRNCSFFPTLKNYQNNQMQQIHVPNCVLCERIPMITKPYPFPMTLQELKVCSRVLVQVLVTRQSQMFYINPGGPTRLSGLKMKLFDKMEGFKGGVDEFVKQLKALYQERYERFKDKMTTQELEMIYNVTLNVIKTFLPESSDEFISYNKPQ